jgi:hypothetical protein
VQSARDTFTRADHELSAANKTLADAKRALQTATNQLTSLKKDHAQASAAKAGAEKALADKKAADEFAHAKVKALKAEIESLAV